MTRLRLPTRTRSARSSRRAAQAPLALERLEDRCLMSTFAVGPGQPYKTINAVPWEKLGAGDTVQVHWQAAGYHEKVLISTSGTATQPIRVVGLPGPHGERPVIDGKDATTRAQAGYTVAARQDRGLITVTTDNAHYYSIKGYKPSYIQIEGLDLRDANPLYNFTDGGGATRTYTENAASIFVERGEHITIRNCVITGSGNGLFVASGEDETLLSRDIRVIGNDIYGNGIAGSDHYHNVYTCASGILFEYNHLGDLRPGSGGIGIKDRSAGTVIRYNWIEGGARLLDLVDPEDSPVMLREPNFHRTEVYGNVFVDGPEDSGNLIHYGGDSGNLSYYRKGTLHFYDNTVIVRADQDKRYRTTLVQPDTNDESVELANNILYVQSATPGATPTQLSLAFSYGNIRVKTNWVSPGWVKSAYDVFNGTITGTNQIIPAANGVNDPGFVNLAKNDFHLTAKSAAIDKGKALEAGDPAVTRQYVAPRSSEPRKVMGAALDLGAFERVVKPGSLQFSTAGFEVAESAGKAVITVTRTGGSDGAVTVHYATHNGTALAGSDYTAAAGTLKFAAGVTRRTFTVTIRRDNTSEPNESIKLTLSSPTGGAALGKQKTAVLTILAGTRALVRPVYVDVHNTAGTANGTAAHPFRSIQAALNAARAGATIDVAAGTYRENVSIPDKSVTLLGGFTGGTATAYAAGKAGDFAASSPSKHVTRITAKSAAAPVVLVNNDIARTIRVEGFTISGGNHGIYVTIDYQADDRNYPNVTIAHNVIEKNGPAALQASGGTYDFYGGGIYSRNATITIAGNVVRNNNANRGGGLYVASNSDFTITKNRVESNTGWDDHGGGVALGALPKSAKGKGTFAYNTVRNNVAAKAYNYGYGGGILIAGDNNPTAIKPVTLADNVFTGNYAPTTGGAIFADNGVTVVLNHDLVYGNHTTTYGGGAIYVDGDGGGTGSFMSILNCTVANNAGPAGTRGNGIYVEEYSHVTVKDSIFWGNGEDFFIVPDKTGSKLTVTYSDTHQTWAGKGNVHKNPLFANPTTGDFHERSAAGRWDPSANGGKGGFVKDTVTSPTIDAGDPAAAFSRETAPNGHRLNMGVYGNTAQASRGK